MGISKLGGVSRDLAPRTRVGNPNPNRVCSGPLVGEAPPNPSVNPKPLKGEGAVRILGWASAWQLPCEACMRVEHLVTPRGYVRAVAELWEGKGACNGDSHVVAFVSATLVERAANPIRRHGYSQDSRRSAWA